jgi:hypothetical protein
VAETARDYIHLYRRDSDALAASLDRVQRTASSILQSIQLDDKTMADTA